MTLIALTAAKSAGVTTSALALAGLWPNPVLLAECDPAGGDIAAGLLRGAQPGGGLLSLALATRRGLTPEQFWDHTRDLSADGSVRLLAGLTDPAQIGSVSASWPLLAAMCRALPPPGSGSASGGDELDVLADCGRLGTDTPTALLAAADVVLLVLRPTLSHVAHARTRLPDLRTRLHGAQVVAPAKFGLLIVGSGPYPPNEVAAALELPCLGVLPDDPAAAAVLSGLADRTPRIERSPLMRAARRVAADLAWQGRPGTPSDPDSDPQSDSRLDVDSESATETVADPAAAPGGADPLPAGVMQP